MESHVYDEIYRLEKSHWWFRGRRIIIYDLLKKFVNKKTTSALDVGCGTGYNYNILKGFSANITGVDNNDIAVSLAKKNFPNLDIIKGDIPFISMDKSYDLITLFDVMEHIPDDEKTMKFLDNILNPGGFLVMTVPAWPFLWSEHDQAVHHQRRYTKRSLIRLINNYPDLKIVKISYYNTILFPFIVLIRFFSLIKYIRKIDLSLRDENGPKTDVFSPPHLVNVVLTKIFSAEKYLLRYINMPFGVSLVCILQKDEKIN